MIFKLKHKDEEPSMLRGKGKEIQAKGIGLSRILVSLRNPGLDEYKGIRWPNRQEAD